MDVVAPIERRGRAVLLAVRLGWGLALLGFPARVVRLLGGSPDRAATRVARLLGARHGLQAIVEALAWPRAVVPGAVLDALHAASMVALARLDPARRAPAEPDAAVESAFAAAGLVLAAAARRRSAVEVRPEL